MGEFDDIDFFRGNELIADPYPYFDYLAREVPGPARAEPRAW